MENLFVTKNMSSTLLSTMKWLKFFGLLGVLDLLLTIIAVAALFTLQLSNVSGYEKYISLAYFAIDVIFLYPLVKLFSQIKNTENAIKSKDQKSLEQAVYDYHSVLKFLGICTIVGFVFYASFIILYFGFLLGVAFPNLHM